MHGRYSFSFSHPTGPGHDCGVHCFLVQADTENPKGKSVSISFFTILVLPAPLGAVMIISF